MLFRRKKGDYTLTFPAGFITKSKRSTRALTFPAGVITKSKRSTRALTFPAGVITKSKRSQVTLFVIIAILIVAGVITFFLLRDKIFVQNIPTEFQPIENAYLNCIQETAKIGANTLAEQGGYIKLPNFEPGSLYMPSSNMLDYFGTGIPYWYYISGNNIVKTQVPTKQDMQDSLSDFLNNNLDCDFSQFIEQGFEIRTGNIQSKTEILNNKVDIELNSDLIISKENKTVKITSHKTSINTNLGNFYEEALKIYNKEKTETFLENYTVDILYTYAPVIGTELSCSPKVWNLNDVRENIKNAIGNNFIFIKGNNFNLKNQELNKYFTVNFNNKDNIRFLYSKEWPTKIEVENSNNDVLIAEPLGNQQGMGILGFCIVPYHFVYDLSFPVLIQIYNDKEIFQFPVVVVIKGNVPREPLENSENFVVEPEICKYKTKDISIYTYDSYLSPVSAEISFKCLNEICDLGKTEIKGDDAVLETKVPPCVNGFLIATSENYSDTKYQISTNEENEAYIMLKKKYNVNINVKSNGRNINEDTIIYFNSGKDFSSLYYPYQKNIGLAESEYNITVYVFKNSTITIPESKTEKCVDVPNGILGIFGVTKKECYDIVIPAQTLNNAVIGGGKLQQYITESELQEGNIEIDVGSLNIPKNIEELQQSYENIETNIISLQAK